MEERKALCAPKTSYGTTNESFHQNERLETANVPSTPTKVVYCIHGNAMGRCLEEGDSSRRSSFDGADSDHCHVGTEPAKDVKARRKLIIASILCLFFMIAEIVGGVLSNSLAIATDAAHLLTDFASFMISLFALWVATRPATQRMSFGWYRAEVIGALTSVILIWVVTGILVYMAVLRIIDSDSYKIESVVMLITAGVGVLVNLIMGCTLFQHGHTHGGGGGSHSHEENINVRAAFIHVVGDLIQSLGVFVAALIIYFKPDWKIADPICTFIFSGLVMLTTFSIVRDALMVLMEGKPNGVDFELVKDTFMGINGVERIHNLRIWALSLDRVALSAHLAISKDADAQKILSSASKNVRAKFNFFEMTLQIEQFEENMENCRRCQMPEN